jgi:hypothetical protein
MVSGFYLSGPTHGRTHDCPIQFRIQLDEIQKIITQARAVRKNRVRVTIQQGE